MKVQLCCGTNQRSGWLNVDLVDLGQDVVADLGKPWDFLDENSVDHIYCKDGFEHQESLEHFLEQSASALKLGGILEIWVPHFKNPSAYRLSHKHFFSWSCFDAYPEHHDKIRNLKVISNRLILGHNDVFPWKTIHRIINIFPKWWERIFYVSNLYVKFKKV